MTAEVTYSFQIAVLRIMNLKNTEQNFNSDKKRETTHLTLKIKRNQNELCSLDVSNKISFQNCAL